jgi:hypothetical protein
MTFCLQPLSPWFSSKALDISLYTLAALAVGPRARQQCARVMSVVGQNRKSSRRAYVFRFTPESGLKSDIPPCPKRAKTGSQAYVEMLREAVLRPQDAHDAELSAEFVELMRKIAA